MVTRLNYNDQISLISYTFSPEMYTLSIIFRGEIVYA